MPVKLLVTDKQPDTGKEMRNKAQLNHEVEHFINFVELLLLDTAVKHFDNKLVEVLLVNTELEQFQITQENILGIVD